MGHQSQGHSLDLNILCFLQWVSPGACVNLISLIECLLGGGQGVDLKMVKWSQILELTVATFTVLEILLNLLKPCFILRTSLVTIEFLESPSSWHGV